METTFHHPLWIVEGAHLDDRPKPDHIKNATEPDAAIAGRWVDAGDLQVGDVVFLMSGRLAAIESLLARTVHTKVYNFHVQHLHNYAVGTNSILVHNNACVQGPPGFSNPAFGTEVHQRFEETLLEQTGTEARHWLIRTKPGMKGVDATYIGPPSLYPGFTYAELKPLSQNGFFTFLRQLRNWALPSGKTQLWFYNKQGVIGSSGTNF